MDWIAVVIGILFLSVVGICILSMLIFITWSVWTTMFEDITESRRNKKGRRDYDRRTY